MQKTDSENEKGPIAGTTGPLILRPRVLIAPSGAAGILAGLRFLWVPPIRCLHQRRPHRDWTRLTAGACQAPNVSKVASAKDFCHCHVCSLFFLPGPTAPPRAGFVTSSGTAMSFWKPVQRDWQGQQSGTWSRTRESGLKARRLTKKPQQRCPARIKDNLLW